MKQFVALVLFVVVPSMALGLECPTGEHGEFAAVAKGKGKAKGTVINQAYQEAQTAGVDEAFQDVADFNAECVDQEGGTLMKDATWRKTPEGPAKTCYDPGNGEFRCKMLVTKHVLCCVAN